VGALLSRVKMWPIVTATSGQLVSTPLRLDLRHWACDKSYSLYLSIWEARHLNLCFAADVVGGQLAGWLVELVLGGVVVGEGGRVCCRR
jgi:hypothetical protein